MSIRQLHESVRKYSGCPKCEHVITLSGWCPTCGWKSPEYEAFLAASSSSPGPTDEGTRR